MNDEELLYAGSPEAIRYNWDSFRRYPHWWTFLALVDELWHAVEDWPVVRLFSGRLRYQFCHYATTGSMDYLDAQEKVQPQGE